MKSLADLFRWDREVAIINQFGEPTGDKVYIKLIGDYEYGEAQRFALSASRKLRKKLNNINGLEYESLFGDIDARATDELVGGIVASEGFDMRSTVEDGMPPLLPEDRYISDLDAETSEEIEEAPIKYQEYLTKRNEDITQKLTDAMEARRVELLDKPREELETLYVKASIEYRCNMEYSTIFSEYMTYLGTFMDSKFKTKAFSSWEEFRNISGVLKNQLVQEYTGLSMSGQDLKN